MKNSSQTWESFNSKYLPKCVRSIWFKVTPNILPTDLWLYKIHLRSINRFTYDLWTEGHNTAPINDVWGGTYNVEVDTNVIHRSQEGHRT